MLTTSPHLRIRRPSPTTIEYIVSTSPTPALPLRLLILFTLFLRLLTGASILLLLYSKYLLSIDTPPPKSLKTPDVFTIAYILHLLAILTASPLGASFSNFAFRIPLIILLPTTLSILYTLTLRIHTTESLLVLRGLGIQTSTSSNTYLSSSTTRFIPTEKIQDILVNEAFRGFEVRYYLVVVVEAEESVVVVFPRLLPGRTIVETVWRGVRGCLFEPEGEGAKGS